MTVLQERTVKRELYKTTGCSSNPISNDMGMHRSSMPEDIRELLELIRAGKLFALQEWIKAGKRLDAPEIEEGQVLQLAVETGFHSIVEHLLRAAKWKPTWLIQPLETALNNRRSDIAELFLNCGAPLQNLDFQTICRTLNFSLMESFLRIGGDPSRDNAFARALSEIKARPLLRFYRQFRAEYPTLDDQAALALSQAVQDEKIRWICLLIWAGADPFRPVPWNLGDAFPISQEESTTAASRAIWQNKPEVLKAMKLRPTPSQARDLLDDAVYRANVDLIRTLLNAIPLNEINDPDRCSSKALENLVRHGSYTSFWSHTVNQDQEASAIKAIELFLDHGARWNPPLEDLRYARRGLLEHDGRYIVQVLRLLLYTPNAVNVESFLELCRSQTLQAKIAATDHPLARELHGFRKMSRSLTAIDTTGRTEITQPVPSTTHQEGVGANLRQLPNHR